MLFVNQETLLRLESVTGVACSFYCCATTARYSDLGAIYNPKTTAMITVLVMLSLVPTARRRRPGSPRGDDLGVLGVGAGLRCWPGSRCSCSGARRPNHRSTPNTMTGGCRTGRAAPAEPRPGLTALRGYLIIAVAVVMARPALTS